MIYIAVILVFIFLFTFFISLFYIRYKEKPIEKLKVYDTTDTKGKESSSKKKKTSIIKALAQLLPHFKISEKINNKIKIDLKKADIPMTPEELFVIRILFSFIFSFLIYSITKDIFISIAVLLVVWYLPRLIIRNKKNSRARRFNEQINGGIIIISNSLKAGYSFLQALTVVVDETEDPFSKEFKILLKEMALGISTEEALKNMLNRVDSQDLSLIVNAILIQNDIGGNLSEILDNISETIRERQKIQKELKTLTAQGKLSGIIIILMPILLGIIIYLFNKEYILMLFNTKMGLGMTIGAIVSQLLGIVMIRKIIKVEM